MKKLLVILVLGLLWSGKAYAEKIYLCVGESGVGYMTAITKDKMKIWVGTKSEKISDLKETDDRYTSEFDDRSIIFFKRTNLIVETLRSNGNQSFETCKLIN